ncbi:MAG: glycosyltransferase family 2 protein [Verrucomicrobiia bacterium]
MTLSVITPSYQQGVWLEETLRSVREAAEVAAPKYRVQHIVVDGGSTDQTLTVLQGQSFASWISEPDDGQTDAINKGMARADGEILCYLCSDDLWDPLTARLVLERFEAEPEIDFVYGDYWFLEMPAGRRRKKRAGPFSYERLVRGNFLSQPATFWRRRVRERFGDFDTRLRYCMDYEFWLRAGRSTRWCYVEHPLALMRLHADAKSSSQLAAAWWEAAVQLGAYRPAWRRWSEAWWMMMVGQHYYRAKRRWFGRKVQIEAR